jgi:plastocyanin
VRRAAAGTALAVAGVLWAAPALADATITAGPAANTFANPDVTIDQGQTITFQNSDSTGAFHDVTADKTGRDGKPLFESQTVEGGKTSRVARVEFLTTGDYAFHCSVHSFMTGTIHVTANGRPQTPTPDNPAPTSDITPPRAGVTILDSRISGVLEHRGVRVKLTTNEPTRFKLTARSGGTTIATGVVTVSGRKRNARLALTKSGRKLLFRANQLKLKVSAKVNDASDNRSTVTGSRTLR